MPTKTFFRLSEEKQKRIMDAAIDEFAEHRFSEASINRIVKTAGIPRGSFYQYFDGKEDLYIHMLKLISEEKLKVFSEYKMSNKNVGIFEMIKEAVPIIFDWADRQPKYSMVALRMAEDDSTFIKGIMEQMDTSKAFMAQLLEQEKEAGKIREDVDVNIIIDLMISTAYSMLQEYYVSGTRESAYKKIISTYDILFHGIMK